MPRQISGVLCSSIGRHIQADPVVIIGVSDRSRGVHIVALYVISQRVEVIYTKVLLALCRVYGAVTGSRTLVKYVMDDAQKSQQNAVEAVFTRVDNDTTEPSQLSSPIYRGTGQTTTTVLLHKSMFFYALLREPAISVSQRGHLGDNMLELQ
jgi:hypothetical protein